MEKGSIQRTVHTILPSSLQRAMAGWALLGAQRVLHSDGQGLSYFRGKGECDPVAGKGALTA